MSIAVGQKAPDFTLLNQDKKEVKLSDSAGKKNVVLMWYPLDWSPTCTNEHACFVNDMKKFETLDAEVLGVSVDSVWSRHQVFPARGFPSARSHERKVWHLPGRQRDHRPRHRYRQ